jgi:hypothetical protein
MKKMRKMTTAALLLALATRSAGASDELDLETTTVTGNQELPRVMVIVPWKKSDPGEPRGKPLGSLLDEALTPVDRAVFRRRLALHEDLRAGVGMHEQETTEE